MGLRLNPNDPKDRKFLEDRGVSKTVIDSLKIHAQKVNKTMDDIETKESRKSKYGNRKTAIGGEVYDSAWEAECHEVLRLMVKSGLIKKVERQIKRKFHHNGQEIWGCVIDFKITFNDNTYKLADAKTMVTTKNRIWRTNVKMLKAFNDEEVILFYRDKGNRTDVYLTVYNLT